MKLDQKQKAMTLLYGKVELRVHFKLHNDLSLEWKGITCASSAHFSSSSLLQEQSWKDDSLLELSDGSSSFGMTETTLGTFDWCFISDDEVEKNHQLFLFSSKLEKGVHPDFIEQTWSY